MIRRIWRALRQLDRVEELERAQSLLLRDMSKMVDRNIELRDALRFYADFETYGGDDARSPCPIETDCGDTARAILGEEEEA